jgi:hypothetical protein
LIADDSTQRFDADRFVGILPVATPTTLADPPSTGSGASQDLFADATMNSTRGKTESKNMGTPRKIPARAPAKNPHSRSARFLPW